MRKVGIFLTVLSIFFIYRVWIIPNQILSSGDFPFYWPEWHGRFNTAIAFSAWAPSINLGATILNLMFTSPYEYFIGIFVSFTNMNVNILLTIGYMWVFIILVTVSPFFLARRLTKNIYLCLITTLVYSINTYILMIIGGGQILGIGIAYSLVPMAIYYFMQVLEQVESSFFPYSKIILFSMVLDLLFMFDIRIAYLALVAIALLTGYFIVLNNLKRKGFIRLTISFCITICILFLLNIYWIVPSYIFHINQLKELGSIYSSTSAVQFFSFAKLEDSISLLHPNWPENIFGKVYFMRPEFLLVPILAYLSLFFVSLKFNNRQQKDNTTILFFAFLGLVGAFLAKGSNPPFGEVYIWLFNHIPGFIMFRDSTKWYVLIALAYSILIPFSLLHLANFIFRILSKVLHVKIKLGAIHFTIFIVFIIFWLFTLWSAVSGQLTGTFKSYVVPEEYAVFKNLLIDDKNFSRVLWVPSLQRFGYYSSLHPAIYANNFFQTYDNRALVKKLRSADSQKILREAAVHYIVVPYDSQAELFLKDRKYDESQYSGLVHGLEAIPWLKRVHSYGKIIVFEISDQKDHFWLTNGQNLAWKMISPTHYQITARNGKIDGRLVFSEAYDQYWQAEFAGKRLSSDRFDQYFNSFFISGIPEVIDIYYTPQKWVDIGLTISIFTLGAIFLILVISKYKSLMKQKLENN